MVGSRFLLELYCLALQLGLFVGLWTMIGKIGYLALKELDGSLNHQNWVIYDGDARMLSYILGPVSLLMVIFMYFLGKYLQLGRYFQRLYQNKKNKKIDPNWDN